MIATANPVCCAKYYDHVINIVISVLLNWDREANAPKPGCGIFGEVTAFYGSTESQSSTGDLHCHMMAWITRFPATVVMYERMCKSASFKQKLIDYLDSVVTTDVPLQYDGKCPKCDEYTLEPLEFGRQAYENIKTREGPSITCWCSSCGHRFGGNEVITGHLERATDEMGCPSSAVSEDAVFARTASSKPLTRPGGNFSIEDVVATRSLLSFQSHHWYHSRSCFKRTKRTPTGKVCRMFFPKKSCNDTKWSSSGSIEQRRKVGNEYINAHIPVVSNTLKCNHDVKLLAAGEGPHKSYYMMKYCAKPQNDVENLAALHLHAYDKANSNTQGMADVFTEGRKRIQSMCCTLSNGQEVPAPLAALYLLRESPFYASHKFATLHLDSIVKVLFHGDQDAVVLKQVGRGTYKPISVLLDYCYRPPTMEETCLIEFKRYWTKKKNRSGVLFQDNHPQHLTHSIHHLSTEAVVTVLGSRLPDVRGQNVEKHVILNYRKRLLTLFVPFRLPGRFIMEDDSLMNLFDTWWDTPAADAAHRYAEFSEDYYESRDVADAKVDDDLVHYDTCAMNELTNAESDTPPSNEVSDNEYDPSNMLDATEWTGGNIDHIKTLERGSRATKHVAAAKLCDEQVDCRMGMVELDAEIEKQQLLARSNQDTITPNRPRLFQDATTRIEFVKAVEGSEEWEPPGEQERMELPERPTLVQISKHFKLNKKQHKMFVVVGRRLLESLVLDDSTILNEPVVSFLGGQPGAGKSQVIRAIQELVGVVPVRLRLEKSVNAELPNRSFRICISQVPLTPAFSITTEKCQGMTLEKIVLAPLQHCTRRSPQRPSFYVATTRVTSLRQLYLMEPLSFEKLKYFTPNPAAMAETQRLERLEATQDNYHTN